MTEQLAFPNFVEPNAPDMKPILLLHRRHDGYVSFHRKDDEGNHEDLFSVPARTLDGIFPQLSPLLEKDSFFSVNGFYQGGYGDARHSPGDLHVDEKGRRVPLPRAYRKSRGIRWLTCCFADLDYHNLGIDFPSAFANVIRAQDAGTIPPASLVTRSGRGMWLFWFLVGDDGKQPVRAWDEKVRLWCNLQRVLGERLADIGSDAAARDVSRITRIAGSVNSKSETRVAYWVQANQLGNKYNYELDSLVDFLGVELPKRNPRIEKARNYLSERGRAGQRGRWLKARKQFEQLWESRRTFSVGTRNNAVFVYASILRSLQGDAKIPESTVREEIERLVDSFSQDGPPFTRDDMESALRGSPGFGRKGRFGGTRNQYISDMLKITPDEANFLETWTAASTFLPTSPDSLEEQDLTRDEKASRRQRLLKEWIETIGFVPTGDEMISFLEERGLPAVRNTVLRDLKSLGIANPRSRKRRRKVSRKNERKLF
jgi:hypothetical protein